MRKGGIKVPDYDYKFGFFLFFVPSILLHIFGWIFSSVLGISQPLCSQIVFSALMRLTKALPSFWVFQLPLPELTDTSRGKASINVRLTSLGFLLFLECSPVILYSFANSNKAQQIFKCILSRFSSSHQERIVKIISLTVTRSNSTFKYLYAYLTKYLT